MSPGSYISFALHLGLVGWMLFSGDFSRKPAEMTVADVSVVSSELFDIMVNEIGRAHVRTPVTEKSRMPSSA